MHTPTLLQTAFTAASLIASSAALPARRSSVVEDFIPTNSPVAPSSRRGSLAPDEHLPGSRRGSFVESMPPSRRGSFVEGASAHPNRALMAGNEDIARSRRRSVFDESPESPARRDSLAAPEDNARARRRSLAEEPVHTPVRRSSLAAPADISNARRRSAIEDSANLPTFRRSSLAAPTDIAAARRRSVLDEQPILRRSAGAAPSPLDIAAARRRSVLPVEDTSGETSPLNLSTATFSDIAAARRRSAIDDTQPERRSPAGGFQEIVNSRRRLFPEVVEQQERRRSSLGAPSPVDIANARRRSALVPEVDEDSEASILRRSQRASPTDISAARRRSLMTEDAGPSRRSSSALANEVPSFFPTFTNSFAEEPVKIYIEEDVAPEDQGPPSASEAQAGVAIPIARREENPLAERGVVDWDAAESHMDKISIKYEKGIIAYQKRSGQGLLGRDLIPDNEIEAREAELARRSTERLARSKRAVNDPDDVDEEHKITFEENFMESFASEFSVGNPALAYHPQKRGNEGASALSSYNNDLLWAGNVQIGSNSQSFTIDFDTGSADLWVPAPNCSGGCDNHHKYDPSKSNTAKKVSSGGLSITYGDGSTTKGDIYTDSVTVGGVTGKNVAIGVATQVGNSFYHDPQDGLMGLAFQSISSMNQTPFIQSLMSQNSIKSGQFSFSLGKSGSELYLGGANGNKYSGNIEWHPVVSESYWVVGGKAQVNGKDASKDFYAIVDTGTTVIVAPPDQAKAFWAQVPGAEPYGNGYYTFPCDSVPKVSFSFGGKQWSVSSDNINLGRTFAGSNECIGAVVGMDVGIDAWILGDSFLKGVYTSFNFDTKQVGFANKKGN